MEKLTFITMLVSTVSSLEDSHGCRFKKETARNYFSFQLLKLKNLEN